MQETSYTDYDTFIRRTVPHYDAILAEVADLLPSFQTDPFSLLDVGCGTGTLVLLLSNRFPDSRYMLCDKSDEMLSAAKKRLAKNKNCTFLQSDILSLTNQWK